MDRKKIELFWKHPGRYTLGLFLVVTLLCILLTFMPKWFNAVFGILLIGAAIVLIRKWEHKEEEKQKN